ncbi:MAG: hypothetical protein Q4B58_03980 [Bacteroidales bacterium]|nr:hypothetical protein [Bacteroidales bacterium]
MTAAKIAQSSAANINIFFVSIAFFCLKIGVSAKNDSILQINSTKSWRNKKYTLSLPNQNRNK